MPPMISAEQHNILLCVCPRYSYCQCHCLSACLSIADALCPRVQPDQLFCQIYLFRCIQRTHSAVFDRLFCGCIHFIIRIAEHICPDAHITDINIFFSIQIPYPASFCPAVICRPEIRKKHFRPFAQQLRASWNNLFCFKIQFLALSYFIFI